MHTILPHQVLIAFAVTLLAGLATVIGGGDGVWMNYYPQQSVMPKVMKPFTGW